jgi:hypothetical protein
MSAAMELRKVSTGVAIRADVLIADGEHDKTIRVLVAELNRLRGCGLQTCKGTELLDVPFGDATVTIEFSYSAAVPGRIWGPPDYCYEDEPEQIDIHGVLINGAMVVPNRFSSDDRALWESCIREHAQDMAEQAQIDAAEARRYG